MKRMEEEITQNKEESTSIDYKAKFEESQIQINKLKRERDEANEMLQTYTAKQNENNVLDFDKIFAGGRK